LATPPQNSRVPDIQSLSTSGGGGGYNVVNKTANYTARIQDAVIVIAPGGGVTISLPPASAAVNPNNSIIVTNAATSSGNVTVSPSGSDTIGTVAGTYVLAPGESVTFFSNLSSDWNPVQ
jgi:hypothetical protein